MRVPRSRRHRRRHDEMPRKHTESVRELAKLVRLPVVDAPDAERPRHRRDCQDGPRPCPWVSCRYHLYLDVSPSGNLTIWYPSLDVDEVPETCALDVAEMEGQTLERVAEHFNVTRERIRQIENKAKVKLARRVPALRALWEEARDARSEHEQRTGREEP